MKRCHRWVLLVSALLAACDVGTYRSAELGINSTERTIQEKRMDAQLAKPVLHQNGYYVNTNPIEFDRSPRWLRQKIDLQAEKMPMQLLVQQTLAGSQMISTYDKTVQSSRAVTLHFKGTVHQALDQISKETGYYYTLQNNHLEWSAFETRTFNVSFMPVSSTYSLGAKQGGNAPAGGENVTGGLQDEQYSNLSANLSIWNDLKRTVDQLKSAEGKVVVSESTTSVTVHDYVSNVDAMADYIDHLNELLSQEVAIQVEVLEVELKKEYNYGIDWDMVGKALNHHYAILGSLGGATNIAGNNLISKSPDSSLLKLMIGQENSHNVFLNALSEQGRLRIVTQPRVVTMNNQVASIRITQDTAYLKSISTTQNENSTQTSITPGTVRSGFTLYLLPKIQDNQVFLQISSTLSDLVRMEKESTAPSNNRRTVSGMADITTDSNSSSNYEAIEVPTLAEKSFNQRSLVQSGASLIIAGYKRLRDETDSASPFDIALLGGKGAETQNVETLIVITPRIIKSTH